MIRFRDKVVISIGENLSDWTVILGSHALLKKVALLVARIPFQCRSLFFCVNVLCCDTAG